MTDCRSHAQQVDLKVRSYSQLMARVLVLSMISSGITLGFGCAGLQPETIVRTTALESCQQLSMQPRTCNHLAVTVEKLTRGEELDLRAEAKAMVAVESPERVRDFAAVIRSLKPLVEKFGALSKKIEYVWLFTDHLFDAANPIAAVHTGATAKHVGPAVWERGLSFIVDCSNSTPTGPCMVRFLAKTEPSRSDLSEQFEIAVPAGLERVTIRATDFRRAANALLANTRGAPK